MQEEVAVMIVFITVVGGAVALLVTSMNNRRRLRELEHRERVAMIERGLVPAPETDPAAFEAATGLREPSRIGRGQRFRTAGVSLIGVGLALLCLLGFTVDAEVAFGVGGAWMMLGGALLLNYFLLQREVEPGPPTRWTPPPVGPTDPPSRDRASGL